MELSKILASCCRQRILKTLSKNKEVAMMKLVKMTGSTYNEVNRNLSILKKENIINKEYRGRNCIIRLNLKNKKTPVLLNALKILDAKFTRVNLMVSQSS